MSMVRRMDAAAVRDDAALPRGVLRLAVGLMCLIALALLAHVLRPEFNRPLTAVDVRGHFSHLTARQIVDATGLTSGQGLLNVNLSVVQQRVQALPWVASATVARRWPGVLDVTVVERIPLARWGDTALLDTRAQSFAPPAADLSAAARAGLPQLAGPVGHETDVLDAWNTLAPALASTPLALAGLTQDARGEFSAVTRGGITLRLGAADVSQRLAMIRSAVLPALAEKFATVGAVDLRYTNGFAVADRAPPAKQEKHS